MKKAFQRLFATLFITASFLVSWSQPGGGWEFDCDCDPMTDTTFVCVIDDGGFVMAFPECLAECLELEIVEGDCEFPDWDGGDDWDNDCDCDPMDEELVCVVDEFG